MVLCLPESIKINAAQKETVKYFERFDEIANDI